MQGVYPADTLGGNAAELQSAARVGQFERDGVSCRQRSAFVFQYKIEEQGIAGAPNPAFSVQIPLQAFLRLHAGYIETAE